MKHTPFSIFPILLALALLLLGACDSALLQEGFSVAPTEPPQPLAETDSAEPAAVLSAFMTAWDSGDLEAMYQLIASRSRELYPQAQFIDQYTAAQSIIRFSGVQHSLSRIEYQGETAVLHYDIVIESSTFGALADENRIMRLVRDDGWKIAWSTMDIFAGMSSRARLTERRVFPTRADIYAQGGEPLAQENSRVYSLYIVKQDMRNVDTCLQTLAQVTRQQSSSLARTFADYLGETRFHIAEIDSAQYERYREALELDCAITRRADDPFSKVRVYDSRSYYGHGIAAHLVGYLGRVPADQLESWEAQGYSSNDLVGRAGIEMSYEKILGGEPQRFLRIVESGGTVIRELGGAVGAPPRSVTLTIDRDLQEITAQAMADAVNYALPNWGGITAGGAIVALEVDSGRLLALASYPSFDPHIFNPQTEYQVAELIARLNADIRNPFSNKATAEQYTPGSVYKIVTALAAAAENIWQADEIFECGYIWRGEAYGDSEPFRSDWRLLDDREPTGPVTMSEALAASCNPFFYQMGAELYAREPLLQVRYAELLGLGKATGLRGLGIEASGDVAPPGEPAAAINNAIGQGDVNVTALQMAQVTALIANGGTLYQPFVVSHIGTEGEPGYQLENAPSVLAELELEADALATVREGMCKVTTVEDLGTAEFVFASAEYSLCGKTGTAETLGNPHAWFVAYWPPQQPQIAFAGVMAHSREGSEVVAPMIRRILDDYLGYSRAPYPEWWQDPYIPVKTQQQALAEYFAEDDS